MSLAGQSGTSTTLDLSAMSTTSLLDKLKQRGSSADNSLVYVEDEAYAWLPARVVKEVEGEDEVEVKLELPRNWEDNTVLSPESTILELEEGQVKHMYRTIDLQDYVKGQLPLQNPSSRGKRDMADLPHLHEAAILYNLKERHANSHPYTRVGDIVVAMNPCVWLHELYSQQTRDFYAKNLIWNSQNDTIEEADDEVVNTFGSMYDRIGYDPHVYETSCLAYSGLATENRNQTILVTGESGAGKTETVKIVMSHLATLELTRPGLSLLEQQSTVVEKVLESSPVFEAFGNAKTLRNDNSSRFGKFSQLQFQVESPEDAAASGRMIPTCLLTGSVCITYLLEKSRVVSHSEGERNYHIYYQLMKAPEEFKSEVWAHLAGTDCQSFKYLGENSEFDLLRPGQDEREWPRTLKALELFQFSGDKLMSLMRALCIVLQLGNLQFVEDPSSAESEEGGTVITTREELHKLQDLLGIAGDEIEKSMTTRILRTGYDTVQVRLSPSVSKESCDALAKEIYARIFDVLVRSINNYTRIQGEKFGTISLLDIFGFERFKINRFEQLCINYANEQLQFKYVLDNFRQVQEEYEAEGIEIFDFSLVDNSDVLNLLSGRLGLLMSLNEECVRPKGNDESFVYKAKVVHQDNDRLVDEKLHRKTEFGIRHFAGLVTYDATKFVVRNTDKLPDDLIICASKSTNELIQVEFNTIVQRMKDEAAAAKPGQRRKKSSSLTVLQKFRSQLKDLMDHMEDTTTRYIRCIKPNDNMTPKVTDHTQTMRQLECAGLVTAIAISRESFPNKLPYQQILHRFRILLTKQDREYMSSVGIKDSIHYMLSNLLISMAEEHPDGTITVPFACGNTKVYFRAGALEALETQRLDFYTQRVVVVQRWVRRIQAQQRFDRMKTAAIEMQRIARGYLEWNRHKRRQAAVTTLCAWARGMKGRGIAMELRKQKAAICIQNVYRTRSKAYQLRRMKRAATIIQRAFRDKEKRDHFNAKLATAVEEARMDNKLLGLKEAVGNQPKSRGSKREVNQELLEEVEVMFDVLRKEIFTLRTKNADLKNEVRESEDDKRELISHAESAEAAASSSRLQVAKLMKSNQLLVDEVQEQKQEMLTMKKDLKKARKIRREEVAAAQLDQARILKERDAELATLQMTIRQGRKSFDQEKKKLKDEIVKLEETHVTEVLRLKDELRRTQDSHHDYLAKLMDVLETTHQAREQETARISAELSAVKEEKDSQIDSLQREVELLRQMNPSNMRQLNKEIEEKANEVKGVRRDLERSSAARIQRSQKFQEVSNRLVAAVSPDNLIAITSARRGRGKKVSVVEEETIRMKKMIRFLEDLYALEESSQATVDNEMLKMLDNYKVASQPNHTVQELQTQLSAAEAENRRLREQVRIQGKCQRCEARDRRRLAKQRSAHRAEMTASPNREVGYRALHAHSSQESQQCEDR